jgi:hypothetical protein
MSQSASSLPPSGPPSVEPVPWESRDRLGIVNAWVENLKLFVLNPQDAFRRAAGGKKGDFLSPLLWAVILATLVSVVSWLWSFVFTAPMLPMMGDERFAAPLAMMMGGGFFQVIMAPILAAIGLFIWTAISHLALMLVGGLERSSWGFEGTLRSVGYAYTAQLANVVPFVGPLIALVWVVVLLVVGYQSVHQTSQGRAIAAALLPLVFCCVCVGIGIAAIVGGIAGMAGLANQ